MSEQPVANQSGQSIEQESDGSASSYARWRGIE